MITTLSGTNQIEIDASLRKITESFVKKYSELAVERIDGEETSLQSLLDAVASLPFLAEKKLVIVRKLSASSELAEQIEQIISSVATEVDVVLWEPKPDKRTVLYKTLKAKTDFKEFSEVDPRDLPKWLVETAASMAGEISLADARYLVERIGTNQQLLANELNKLITYSSKIDRTSIDLLSQKAPQSKVFDLMDAAFSGNKSRALSLYDEQRAQRVEPQEILAMLAWQLRLIGIAKIAQNKTADGIAKDLGSSPFPVSKAQSLAAKISDSKMVQMVAWAENIDKQTKTSSIDLDEALKTYITTVL